MNEFDFTDEELEAMQREIDEFMSVQLNCPEFSDTEMMALMAGIEEMMSDLNLDTDLDTDLDTELDLPRP